MNSIGLAVGAALIAATLAGCAGTAPANDAADASDKVCVNVRMINGFNPLSDRELFVTANVKDYYLFTVFGTCTGLRSANAIAVADPTTRICDDGFGKIAFRDPGLGRQVCRVDHVEQIGSREEAEELVAARRDARREKSEN